MKRPGLILLTLSYLAFISLGLPDTVLGVAWPSVRAAFGLSQSGLGLVLAAGVGGYFASGLVAGRLVMRFGVGGLLAASSGLVALGLVGFTVAPSWGCFFPMTTVIGLGSGAIDATLNGYAARHFRVRHLNWLHACWSVGATIGPFIMTAAIARTNSFRVGYLILAFALAAMALAFTATRHFWGDGARTPDSKVVAEDAPKVNSVNEKVSTWQALRSRKVWLQIAIFFVYTGLEGGTGQWCFTVLRESRGLGIEAAGTWTTIYWGSLMVGRVMFGFIIDRFGPDRLLRLCSLTALTGAALYATGNGFVGGLGLIALGASLAPFYPTLMARTPARLGEAVTSHAVGFQVSAATLGSVAIPGAIGLVADRAGIGVIAPILAGTAALFWLLHERLLRSTGTEDAFGERAQPELK